MLLSAVVEFAASIVVGQLRPRIWELATLHKRYIQCCQFLPKTMSPSFVLSAALNIQGDHSSCVKPPVDIKTKVPFGFRMRPMY